jgi:hypothetical protein
MQSFIKDLLKSSGPDPDPPDLHVFGLPGSGFVRGTDPDPCLVLLSSSKNSKKNLDSYCFVTSFGLFIFNK